MIIEEPHQKSFSDTDSKSKKDKLYRVSEHNEQQTINISDSVGPEQ